MRGRTGGMALAAITSIVLVASACGGGGSEPQPGTSQAGAQGGEIAIPKLYPAEPADPGEHQRGLWRRIMLDAIDCEAGALQRRHGRPRVGHRPVDRDQGQPDTSRSSSSRATSSTTAPRSRPRTSSMPGTGTRTARTAILNAYFFEPVAGYDDLQCGTDSKGNADCEGKPAKAKDDDAVSRSSTTTPSPSRPPSKVSNLPVRLGYTAFAPLPDSFFTDPKAFGEKPIGAGPFKLDSKTDTEMVVLEVRRLLGQVQAERRQGDLPDLQRPGAAYNDVVAEQPRLHRRRSRPTGLIDDLYKQRAARTAIGVEAVRYDRDHDVLPDRPTTSRTPELRKAISMAIDRDLINKQIFNGTGRRLTGWVSPVVDGFKAGACGECCKFDPAEAKAAVRRSRRLQGWPADHRPSTPTAGHKPWAEAACNSIKNTLGLDCVTQGDPGLQDPPRPDRQERDQGPVPDGRGRWTTRRSRTSSPRSTPRAPVRTTPNTATRSSTPS